MKNLIKVILLLLISLPTFGQEKTLEQVDGSNNYRYTTYHTNGDIHQIGWFKRIDGKLKEMVYGKIQMVQRYHMIMVNEFGFNQLTNLCILIKI